MVFKDGSSKFIMFKHINWLIYNISNDFPTVFTKTAAINLYIKVWPEISRNKVTLVIWQCFFHSTVPRHGSKGNYGLVVRIDDV